MFKDFVSEEPRTYGFKIGRLIASSLSGFIAGIIGGMVMAWILINYGI